jgi:hypothetical protein
VSVAPTSRHPPPRPTPNPPTPTRRKIIIGDNFSSLAQAAFGAHVATGRQFITSAVTALVILPMCFARSLSALGGWPRGRGGYEPALGMAGWRLERLRK